MFCCLFHDGLSEEDLGLALDCRTANRTNVRRKFAGALTAAANVVARLQKSVLCTFEAHDALHTSLNIAARHAGHARCRRSRGHRGCRGHGRSHVEASSSGVTHALDRSSSSSRRIVDEGEPGDITTTNRGVVPGTKDQIAASASTGLLHSLETHIGACEDLHAAQPGCDGRDVRELRPGDLLGEVARTLAGHNEEVGCGVHAGLHLADNAAVVGGIAPHRVGEPGDGHLVDEGVLPGHHLELEVVVVDLWGGHTQTKGKGALGTGSRHVEATDDGKNNRDGLVTRKRLWEGNVELKDVRAARLAGHVERIASNRGVALYNTSAERWTAFVRNKGKPRGTSTPNTSLVQSDEIDIHALVADIRGLQLDAKRARNQKINSVKTHENLRNSTKCLGEVHMLFETPLCISGSRAVGTPQFPPASAQSRITTLAGPHSTINCFK